METIILVRKASPVHDDDEVDDLVIKACGSAEHVPYEVCRQMYQNDADAIVDAFYKHLPGGLIDRILIRMLERAASILKVSYTKKERQ